MNIEINSNLRSENYHRNTYLTMILFIDWWVMRKVWFEVLLDSLFGFHKIFKITMWTISVNDIKWSTCTCKPGRSRLFTIDLLLRNALVKGNVFSQSGVKMATVYFITVDGLKRYTCDVRTINISYWNTCCWKSIVRKFKYTRVINL